MYLATDCKSNCWASSLADLRPLTRRFCENSLLTLVSHSALSRCCRVTPDRTLFGQMTFSLRRRSKVSRQGTPACGPTIVRYGPDRPRHSGDSMIRSGNDPMRSFDGGNVPKP